MQDFKCWIKVLVARNLLQDRNGARGERKTHVAQRLSSHLTKLFVRHALQEGFGDVRGGYRPTPICRFTDQQTLTVPLGGTSVPFQSRGIKVLEASDGQACSYYAP